jgi:sugar O-acyltransferase (sialic acid O-acetyltransferase NeuD family)
MQKYELIGHCNRALSLILDTIKFIEKDNNVEITIVTACNDDFLDTSYNMPFNPGLSIKETSTEVWEPEPECLRIIVSMDEIRRRELFSNVEELFEAETDDFDTLIHPLSYCSNTTKLGHGIFISPNSTLAPFSEIGNFTYINRGTNIGHHTTIGEFCTISPGCNIAGECLIENNVNIGIGATILDGIKIGYSSTIGAGSVVTKDVKSDSVYYGVPAKFIRKKRGEF